jgi:hypothetical protein
MIGHYFVLGNRRLLLALMSPFLILTPLLSGCGGGNSPSTVTMVTTDASLASRLRTAEETVTLSSGQVLSLKPYLWRDFQPVSPSDGKPLIASFRVRIADDTPLPEGVTVNAAWVLYGNAVWSSQPVAEYASPSGSSSFEVMSRNGPKWGPNVAVDVIVQVRDARNATYLLQSANQNIHRTD